MKNSLNNRIKWFLGLACSAIVLTLFSHCDLASDNGGSGSGSTGGGVDPTIYVGDCDKAASGGSCQEYQGSTLQAEVITLQTSCAQLNGTWSTSARCTSINTLGQCTVTGPGEILTIYYYNTNTNANAAQADCLAQQGTFVSASG